MYLIQHKIIKYYFDGKTWCKSRLSAKVYSAADVVQAPIESIPVNFINAVTNQIEILHNKRQANVHSEANTLRLSRCFFGFTGRAC